MTESLKDKLTKLTDITEKRLRNYLGRFCNDYTRS